MWVIVAILADCRANSSPPWSAYLALIKCCLVALDKRPGVRPVGIGETLRQALDKLIMRAAGDQANKACGNLHLCAGHKACIERATHARRQMRLERVRARQREDVVEASYEEEGSRNMVEGMGNLTTATASTKEEAEENPEVALGMETEEAGGDMVEGE